MPYVCVFLWILFAYMCFGATFANKIEKGTYEVLLFWNRAREQSSAPKIRQSLFTLKNEPLSTMVCPLSAVVCDCEEWTVKVPRRSPLADESCTKKVQESRQDGGCGGIGKAVAVGVVGIGRAMTRLIRGVMARLLGTRTGPEPAGQGRAEQGRTDYLGEGDEMSAGCGVPEVCIGEERDPGRHLFSLVLLGVRRLDSGDGFTGLRVCWWQDAYERLGMQSVRASQV